MAQQVDGGFDGLAHGGEPLGVEFGRDEMGCADEVLVDLHVPEGDDGHFHPPGAEAVGLEGRFEALQALVQLLDAPAAHGGRDIEQEQAGAARFGVLDKFRQGKGIGVHVHWFAPDEWA